MRIKQFSLSFVSSNDSIAIPSENNSKIYDAVVQLKPKGTYSYIYYSIFPENTALPYEGMVCNTPHTSPCFKVSNVNPFDNHFIVLYEIDAYTQQPLQRIWETFYSINPSYYFDHSKYDVSLVGPSNSDELNYNITNNDELIKTNKTIDELLAELDSIVIDCDINKTKVVYILEDYFQENNNKSNKSNECNECEKNNEKDTNELPIEIVLHHKNKKSN